MVPTDRTPQSPLNGAKPLAAETWAMLGVSRLDLGFNVLLLTVQVLLMHVRLSGMTA